MREILMEIFAVIGMAFTCFGIVGIIWACVDDWLEHHKKRCIKCGHMADKWYYDYCPYCGTKLE